LKRNLDLIRKLVLAVEDLPTGMVLTSIELDGHSAEEIGYHSYLAVDSGLARGVDIQTLDDTSPNWQLLHLTSEGHDFADAARSESTWKKAKTIIAAKGGGFTFEVVKQVLVSVIKSTLES
jgi:Hypothetical protein (DUF2513)